MPQKYQTIPKRSDSDSDGEDGRTMQTFEVDSGDAQNYDPTVHQKRGSYSIILKALSALFIMLVGYGVHMSGNSSGRRSTTDVPTPTPKDEGMNSEMPDEKTTEDSLPKIIFCYGDSLTYGISPPGRETYPYSKYLEQDLNLLYNPSEPSGESQPATIVQHLGLPGWTSEQMLQHINDDKTGMCPIIRGITHPNVSLMVILAGTNDLGMMTESDKSEARKIIESIIKLHQAAINCAGTGPASKKFHTLSVGIPESAWQKKVPIVAELAEYVNNGIKHFASSEEAGGRVSYIDFPFGFDDKDTRWSMDGLHFSAEGYQALGKQLAFPVKKLLDEKIDDR